MPVQGEWIRFGTQRGYFACPPRGTRPLPSVVVLQEIWGVEEQIVDTTRRIAAAGYAAYAPDLFAPGGVRAASLSDERISQVQKFIATLPPGTWGNSEIRDAALDKLPEPGRSELRESFQGVFQLVGNLPGAVPTVRDAVHYLKHERQETKDQPVGCVGFCMGGGLTALLGCEEPELSAAAIYYGTPPAAEKVPGITCPVIGFYGGTDQRVNAQIPAFEQAMKAAGKSFDHIVYEGADHGFFNEQSPRYHLGASRDSFVRLLTFFRTHLVT